MARSSLEELRLDYEDFLRQRGLPLWGKDDPRRDDLVAKRCKTADEVAAWIQEIRSREQSKDSKRERDLKSISSIESISPSTPGRPSYPGLAANTALVPIGVAVSLLDRQIKSLARSFEQRGGFTERMYHTRRNKR